MKKGGQCYRLLQALQAGRKMTGMEIIHELNILNYKGRASDLRLKYGYNIHTEMIERPSGARVAQYSLPKIDTNGQMKLL